MPIKSAVWLLTVLLMTCAICFGQAQQAPPQDKPQKAVFETSADRNAKRLILQWNDSAIKGDADFAELIVQFQKELKPYFEQGNTCGYVLVELKLSASGKFRKVELTTGRTESFLLSSYALALPTGETRAADIKSWVERALKFLPSCEAGT